MIAAAECREPPVPTSGIEHELGAVEGGTEHRRMRNLAAQPAAHAGIVDVRHRVLAQADPGSDEWSATDSRTSGCRSDRRCRCRHRLRSVRAPRALPPAIARFCCGRSRRCRLSMHSEAATMTLGPFSAVVIASRSVSSMRFKIIGAVDHAQPLDANALHRLRDRVLGALRCGYRRARTECPDRRWPPNSRCRRSRARCRSG